MNSYDPVGSNSCVNGAHYASQKFNETTTFPDYLHGAQCYCQCGCLWWNPDARAWQDARKKGVR